MLEGRSPQSLVHTYSAERHAVAKMLIDFDKEWSTIMASPPKDPANPDAGGVDPTELQAYYVQSLRYTAGVATHYMPSTLTGEATYQHLAKGFTIGTRFHSATVTRLADAKPMHLGHCHRADGRWRLFAFADAAGPGDPASRLRVLCEHLAQSLVPRYTPTGADRDAVFDVRAVLQQHHRDLRLEDLPSLLLPRKGRYGLIDYEKAFAPDWTTGADDIFDLRGIDREQGALVVVRPRRRLLVSMRSPSSGRLVRPIGMAPAASIRSTIGAFADGSASASTVSPLVVGVPSRSMFSFTVIGTPCSGPVAGMRSIASAAARA